MSSDTLKTPFEVGSMTRSKRFLMTANVGGGAAKLGAFAWGRVGVAAAGLLCGMALAALPDPIGVDPDDFAAVCCCGPVGPASAGVATL